MLAEQKLDSNKKKLVTINKLKKKEAKRIFLIPY